jgi:hypothetical protein
MLSICRAVFLLQVLGEDVWIWLFLFSQVACIPWSMAPSSIFKTLYFPPHISKSPPSLFPLQGSFRLYWAHSNHPELSPHLKVFHLISSAESLLSPKFTGSRDQNALREDGWCFSVCHTLESFFLGASWQVTHLWPCLCIWDRKTVSTWLSHSEPRPLQYFMCQTSCQQYSAQVIYSVDGLPFALM